MQHLHTYVILSPLEKLLSRLSSVLLSMSGALWSSLTMGGGCTKPRYFLSQIVQRNVINLSSHQSCR